MALTKSNGVWTGVVGSVNGSGTQTVGTLQTAGTYVDANITVQATVADAVLQAITSATPTATTTFTTGASTYLTDDNTGYKITASATPSTATVTGRTPVKTAGWADTTDTMSITGVTGSAATADKYIIAGALSNANGGAVTATAGLANNETYLTDTTTSYPITATADASAADSTTGVTTAGWIPKTATATVTGQTATQATKTRYIKAGALKTTTGGATTATAGFATSSDLTSTNTGFAITATADASSANTTVSPVNTAGWIPTTATATVNGTTATQDTETKYIIAGSVANAATEGVTYTDVTSTKGVALVSGDYLYINRGMFDNVKISLAKLVPDGSNVKGAEAYLYNTKTAYDNDGVLVTGSMAKAAIAAAVTSATASASITSITPSYNSTSGKYDVSGSGNITGTANVSASVTTSGLAVNETDNTASTGKYAGLGVTSASNSGDISGTASLSGVTLDAAVLQNDKGTDGAVKPVIAVNTTNNNASIGTLTTSKPSSGNYIAVNTAAISASTTVTASVSSDGYADTTNTNKPEVTVTRGASASDIAYIPINAAALGASGAVTTVTPSYNSTNKNYDVAVTGTANASTSTTGYAVKDSTKASANITSSATLTAGVLQASSDSVTPTISKNSDTNATASSDATTTKPDSGYYIAVKSASTSKKSTASVKTAGYVDSNTASVDGTITVNASATTYIPLTTSTHKIATNGTASVTNATLTNTQAASGTLNSSSITPVTYSSASAAGSNYIQVTATAEQKTAGAVTIPLKCDSTAGYTGGDQVTFSATNSAVGVTSQTGSIFFKVYNGELVTA